jgi:PDZ domain
MKSVKTWSVAIGCLCLAGAILPPAGRAQSAPGQPVQAPAPKFQPNGARDGRFWNTQGANNEYYRWLAYPSWGDGQQRWQALIGPDGAGQFLTSDGAADLSLAAPDQALRDHLNLPKGQGVVVIAVDPHSSAAAAGIQQNDVLLSLGEGPLKQPDDLYDLLKKAGDKPVALVLLRGGDRVTLKVQPLVRVTLGPAAAKAPTREFWIGVSVNAIGPVLRAQLRLSQSCPVIVNQVVPEGPAAKAGIALNDILLSIDGRPIVNLQDLANAAQSSGGKPLELGLIGKGGKPRNVTVTPARRKNVTAVTHDAPKTVTYDVVHPGALFENTKFFADAVKKTGFQPVGDLLVQAQSSQAQKSQEAPGGLTNRLDSLDSDLKELRKLVEALQKSATKIIERQKGDGDRSSKD